MDRNEFIGAVIGYPVGMPYWHEYVNGERHVITKATIHSTMLPIAQPDVVHTFTGQTWCEREAARITERTGEPVNPWSDEVWPDDDEAYMRAVREFSRRIIRLMPTSNDGPLRRVQYVLADAPQNDMNGGAFSACYRVDLTALGAYVETRTDVDLRTYWTEDAPVYWHAYRRVMWDKTPRLMHLVGGLSLWLDDCAVQQCYEGTFAQWQTRKLKACEIDVWDRAFNPVPYARRLKEERETQAA